MKGNFIEFDSTVFLLLVEKKIIFYIANKLIIKLEKCHTCNNVKLPILSILPILPILSMISILSIISKLSIFQYFQNFNTFKTSNTFNNFNTFNTANILNFYVGSSILLEFLFSWVLFLKISLDFVIGCSSLKVSVDLGEGVDQVGREPGQQPPRHPAHYLVHGEVSHRQSDAHIEP